jgi:ABC-type nickel/cobalt efflux system permease component RcnA
MLAEAGTACTSLWCDYLSTQFDPAHLLSELGFTIIFDLILVWLVWGKLIKPYLDKRVNQAHTDFDTDHGITHHEDHVHVESHDHERAG